MASRCILLQIMVRRVAAVEGMEMVGSEEATDEEDFQIPAVR